MNKIGFGGGCHWCTEAVYQSLNGVKDVEQGYISSIKNDSSFSEAVIVHFNPNIIDVRSLIAIHLHTHKCTSNHSMRTKYRSAVYTFDKGQTKLFMDIIKDFQKEFSDEIITQVLPFGKFKPSREQIKNYYFDNPEKPFCENFVSPKLNLIMDRFSDKVNITKLEHLI